MLSSLTLFASLVPFAWVPGPGPQVLDPGSQAPGPGPHLLSPAHSHSAACEYSCSWRHYHGQRCLCFCLRALKPCSGGSGSNLLPENNLMFFHLLRVLHLCVTVVRKPLNNSRLLYSSGCDRTKPGNVLGEIREGT